MYPILAGIYGDEYDPVDHKTLNSIRSMLSEIVHLLDASQEGLKVKGFGGHDIMFVQVPRLASDKSFNNTKSWVHPTTFESAFRVSNHLCRFYKDAFIAAMEKQGMPIAQPMSTQPLHLYFNSKDDDLFVCSFNTPPPDSPPHALLLRDHTTIEISVFVTGDLAFQAMIMRRFRRRSRRR
jgi:hypothetical protein